MASGAPCWRTSRSARDRAANDGAEHRQFRAFPGASGQSGSDRDLPRGRAAGQRGASRFGAAPVSAAAMRQAKETASKALLDGYARVETPSKAFGEALARSLTDVALLQVRRGGTDSPLQAYRGSSACSAATACCQQFSAWRSIPISAATPPSRWRIGKERKTTQGLREEPGKILHELRVGELAHLDEVSQTPSYAAVDSTLLFLIAIARHVAWTGEMALFDLLRPNIDRALDWLSCKTDENESGYVTYDGLAEGRPAHQSELARFRHGGLAQGR